MASRHSQRDNTSHPCNLTNRSQEYELQEGQIPKSSALRLSMCTQSMFAVLLGCARARWLRLTWRSSSGNFGNLGKVEGLVSGGVGALRLLILTADELVCETARGLRSSWRMLLSSALRWWRVATENSVI